MKVKLMTTPQVPPPPPRMAQKREVSVVKELRPSRSVKVVPCSFTTATVPFAETPVT